MSRLDLFLVIREKHTNEQLTFIYQVVNKCWWNSYGVLSVVPCAYGNMRLNYQKFLNHFPFWHPLFQAGSSTYLYLKVPSQITFGIASCLLRDIETSGGKEEAGTFWSTGLGVAWTWLFAHSSCPCPGPLAGKLFVSFPSLLLVSPDFEPVHASAPVFCKSGSQLHCLLGSTPVNSWVRPCVDLTWWL